MNLGAKLLIGIVSLGCVSGGGYMVHKNFASLEKTSSDLEEKNKTQNNVQPKVQQEQVPKPEAVVSKP